jgi:hypothetical protein
MHRIYGPAARCKGIRTEWSFGPRFYGPAARCKGIRTEWSFGPR